uniref:Uncharacterized protein n=1 Tax=viral metagenome TaxID=1070528 RepID=A0A6C0B644_9ZZZZ
MDTSLFGCGDDTYYVFESTEGLYTFAHFKCRPNVGIFE